MDAGAELPGAPFEEDGYIEDEAVEEYVDGVMTRFAASPECRELAEAGGDVFWSAALMEYGLRYLGVGLERMRARDLDEIVFRIFPRKVSCEPTAAGEVVSELRAFWRFLQREHDLPHAAACRRFLDDPGLPDALEAELANPANYGMAKSFFMAGREAGFDMTTQEGLRAYQAVYNAGRIIDAKPRDRNTGDRGTRPVASGRADARKAKRRKRKQQKQSRRQNRKRR